MFDLPGYLETLTVDSKDEDVKRSLELVELIGIICDDAWLCRQAYYGMAGAMERQIDYLGSTLVPNAETRVSRLASSGIRGESYVQDSWFGTTNEDDAHVNDEVGSEQALADAQEFLRNLEYRMRTAAIIFVTHVRAHDSISKDLDQLSYGQIKAKAEANRKATQAA